jgi:hypothetical protein
MLEKISENKYTSREMTNLKKKFKELSTIMENINYSAQSSSSNWGLMKSGLVIMKSFLISNIHIQQNRMGKKIILIKFCQYTSMSRHAFFSSYIIYDQLNKEFSCASKKKKY